MYSPFCLEYCFYSSDLQFFLILRDALWPLLNHDFGYSPMPPIWNLVCLCNVVLSILKNYHSNRQSSNLSLLMVIAFSASPLHWEWYCFLSPISPFHFTRLLQVMPFRFSFITCILYSFFNLMTSISYLIFMSIMSKRESIMACPSSFSKSYFVKYSSLDMIYLHML